MDRPRWLAVYRSVPYALTWLGLVGGLVVLVFAPFPSAAVNYLVGGVLLAVAVGSVTLLIIEHSGPGERGPDF